jgi:hypothetical protein
VTNPRGINGTDVVLLVGDFNGDDSSPIAIPAQRSLTQSETVAPIDMSSKDDPAMRRAPGRYETKLSLTALYLPGASGFDQLQSAFRNRQYITVVRNEPTSRTSWPTGSASGIEEASAIITDMSPAFPDQGASVITLAIEIDGGWAAVGSGEPD